MALPRDRPVVVTRNARMCHDLVSRNPLVGGHADDGAEAAPQPNAFRIVIHPFHGPSEGVDITDALVDAVVQVLWKLQGGNEPVNQLEARVLLEQAIGRRGGECDQQAST
jgi:hypothetical protein